MTESKQNTMPTFDSSNKFKLKDLNDHMATLEEHLTPSWSLDEKDQILQFSNQNAWNRTFYEQINMSRLYAIFKSKNCEKFATKYYAEDSRLKKYKMDFKNFLQDIMNNVKKHHGVWFLPVTHFSPIIKGDERSFLGRVYPANNRSLGMMMRPARHFICEDDYFDIDMVNSNYVIALHLTDVLDSSKKYPTMKFYMKNRETMLADIQKAFDMSRGDAKQLFISILNRGDALFYIKNEKGENSDCLNAIKKFPLFKKIKKLQKECRKLHDKMRESYLGNKVWGEILDTGKPQTTEAYFKSFIAKYFTVYENLGLMYLKSRAVELLNLTEANPEFVAIHDGGQIPKKFFQKISPDEFVKNLNENAKDYLNGFSPIFKVKAFDEADKVRKILEEEKIDFTLPYEDAFFTKYGVYRNDDVEDNALALAKYYLFGNKGQMVSFIKDGDKNAIYKKNDFGILRLSSKKEIALKFAEGMEWFDNNNKRKYKNMMCQAMRDLEIAKLLILKETENKINIMKKFDSNFLSSLSKANKLLQNHANTISKYITDKGTSVVINKIISLVTDENAQDKFDTNNHLLGFNNGVFDLKSFLKDNECFNFEKHLRPAKEGEFVTMTCGYNFVFNAETQERATKVFNIIRAMFENEETFIFQLKYFAGCLEGNNNHDQKSWWGIGEGENGKSLLFLMMECALGEYYSTLDSRNFTKSSQDEKSVELANCERARMIIVEEPESQVSAQKEVKISTATFKKFTGESTISCRRLYTNKMTHFKPSKLFFAINPDNRLYFNGGTESNSMLRRFVVTHFPHEFKNAQEYDKNNPKHRKQDNTLTRYMKENETKAGIMILLLKYYKIKHNNGNKIPESVQKSTKEFLKNLNKDKEWFDDNFRKDISGYNITLTEAYRHYKEDADDKKITKPEFQEKLRKLGYEIKKGQKARHIYDHTKDKNSNNNTVITNVRFVGKIPE